ncbi:MAG TPA: DUF2695 domain-containing protein [Streptosporangiaceae bacterium]|jgi:Protein of unknown function (DUF2695)
MMADDMSREVETELADLAERLTAPARAECLRCFLLRMITEFGCDGTFRWTIRWRDVCAGQPGKLLDQLAGRGGYCDCEVLVNVYPDYPPVDVALSCAGVPKPGSSRPCDLRRLRKTA